MDSCLGELSILCEEANCNEGYSATGKGLLAGAVVGMGWGAVVAVRQLITGVRDRKQAKAKIKQLSAHIKQLEEKGDRKGVKKLRRLLVELDKSTNGKYNAFMFWGSHVLNTLLNISVAGTMGFIAGAGVGAVTGKIIKRSKTDG